MQFYDFFSNQNVIRPTNFKAPENRKKLKTLFLNICEFLLTILTPNLPIGICLDFGGYYFETPQPWLL